MHEHVRADMFSALAWHRDLWPRRQSELKLNELLHAPNSRHVDLRRRGSLQNQCRHSLAMLMSGADRFGLLLCGLRFQPWEKLLEEAHYHQSEFGSAVVTRIPTTWETTSASCDPRESRGRIK